MNPLLRLREAGQSVWLDFLRRSLITGGGLERLVREDGVSGLTSNPSIFGKAIGDSTDYDEAIRAIAEKDGRTPIEVFYDLALADVQMAADVFLPVFQDTGGADGLVSFELEPRLAHDTEGSIEAAVDLFTRIGKPNGMIKGPGTDQGGGGGEGVTAGRGGGGGRGAHRRRCERQHHAAVLRRDVRESGGGIPARPRAPNGGGSTARRHRLGRLVLRLSGRHRGGRTR